MKLGEPVSKESAEAGRYYAVPEKNGYLLVMAALVETQDAFIILGASDTNTLDEPPVWVWRNSVPAATCFELEGAHIEFAHKSGSTAPAGDSERELRHGEILEDDQGKQYLYLKQKLDKRAFLLEDGRSWPSFDPALIFSRWRLRQNGETLAEFESC